MPKMSRINDALACTDRVAAGSGTVFANGLGVARMNDPTTGHPSYSPTQMTEASSSVKAEGRGICRVGDRHAGHTGGPFHRTALTAGSTNTNAGG